MNPLDQLFGKPVQRIDAIMAELFSDVKDDLRKQKACKIEDIMRGLKMAQIYDPSARIAYKDCVTTFDKLYDSDMHTLEAYSHALDTMNTRYMRGKASQHNRAEWNKEDNDDSGWLHLDIR